MKRIKELIKQAGFEETDGHISIQGVYMFNTYRMENLVELIVRECADHIDDLVTCDDDGNQMLDCDDVRTELLEHFGVEE